MQATRLGSYELIRRLGEGGMAQVYLARDIRLGREVAIKVLDSRLAQRSGFRDRFLREARVAAALDHPGIVPLYDFGDNDGVLYLVMPYISGGSLQDALKRAPFPASDVVSYGTQITDALDYAHQRGVIHRDVKPANMLLHADGRLMLADFGLAKIFDGSARAANRQGKPDAGTPEYMAPEQIQGRTDARSDLYGLGVVLYLLLTGHLPFTGASSNAVMDGHLYRLAEAPRHLNPTVTRALEDVVMRALAKHPADRYQRANEMGAALLEALVAGDAEPPDLGLGLGPSSPIFSRPPALPDVSFVPQPISPFPQGFAGSNGSLGSQGSQGARLAGQAGSISFLPSLDMPEARSHSSMPNSAGARASHPRATGSPFSSDVPPAHRLSPAREFLPTQPLSGVNPGANPSVNPSGGMDLPLGMNPALGMSMPSEGAAGDPRSQTSQGILASSVAQARSPRPALDSEPEDEQRHGRGRWLWIAIAMLLALMAVALGGLIWLFPG